MQCTNCDGTGRISCAACWNGQRKISCADCNGKGSLPGPGGSTQPCPRCHGRGSLVPPSCPKCGNSKECPQCAGKGQA